MLAGALALLPGLIALAHYWSSGGRLPGPAPERAAAFDAAHENAACEDCHREIAREWRGSQHQTAFADPSFQRAFAVEPTAFCRGCHAPESPHIEVAPGPATDIGVSCVSCHLRGDAVMAAPKSGFSLAPHRLEGSPAFAAAGGCSGCHQFSFGDDERREAPLAMQRTVDEHAASAHAETSCAECHMPSAGEGSLRHRSHAFASTRDPDAHRNAVEVTAARSADGKVRFVLSLRDVGHAYPTGDLFRRVAVSAEVLGVEGRSLASRAVYLGRHFGRELDAQGLPIRGESADDRLGPAPTTVELDLGSVAVGVPIEWSVELQRVLHQNDGMAASAVVEESLVLAEGSLPR